MFYQKTAAEDEFFLLLIKNLVLHVLNHVGDSCFFSRNGCKEICAKVVLQKAVVNVGE